jgi:hypothetical protein
MDPMARIAAITFTAGVAAVVYKRYAHWRDNGAPERFLRFRYHFWMAAPWAVAGLIVAFAGFWYWAAHTY